MTTCDSATEATSAIIRHKRGDSFAPTITVTDSETGLVPDGGISGWGIESHVRTPGGALVADMVLASRDDAAGLIELDAGDTNDWPIGRLEWDIQYTVGSYTFSTPTQLILVVRDVTRP